MLNKRTYKYYILQEYKNRKTRAKAIETSETEKQTLFNEHLKFIESLRVKSKVYKSPCCSYLIGT